MREPYRVCWVGDEPTVTKQTRTAMADADPPLDVTVEPAGSIPERGRALARDDCDCLVLELADDAALGRIAEGPGTVPTVAVAGDGDVSAALAAGAADVLRRETIRAEPALVARRLGTVVEANAARPARSAAADGSARLQRYRTVVETAADPMYVLDSSGRCVLANDALARFSGYDRDALVGSHASTFIGRADFERASERLADLVASDDDFDRFEFTLETADGEQRVGEATVAVIANDGRARGSVGVVRDVSERARRTRELARYRTLVESAPIGLFAVDETGTVTWANDEFVGPFAESADEIVGSPFASLVERGYFDPDVIERYADHVRRLLSDENDVTEITHEPQLHTPDGETKTYRATLTTLPLEDGEFTGTVNAFREVTDERRYQRELERQNDRLERFASLVSHDLRNPLNVAQGHADLLAREIDHDSVSEITWALDRMSTLIEDLLTLARQGETVGETKRIELASVVDDAWAVVDGPASLRCDVAGTVSADRSRLCELFTNMFRNAVEHSSTSHIESDGSVDAVEHSSTNRTEPNCSADAVEHGSTSRAEPDGSADAGRSSASSGSQARQDAAEPALESADGASRGDVTDRRETDAAASESEPPLQLTVGWVDEASGPAGEPGGFFVEDDGPGLPDIDVFEAGVTTDPEGTGIGLAIVAEIAEAHGWTVSAGESASGGARFEIRDVDSARSDTSGR